MKKRKMDGRGRKALVSYISVNRDMTGNEDLSDRPEES